MTATRTTTDKAPRSERKACSAISRSCSPSSGFRPRSPIIERLLQRPAVRPARLRSDRRPTACPRSSSCTSAEHARRVPRRRSPRAARCGCTPTATLAAHIARLRRPDHPRGARARRRPRRARLPNRRSADAKPYTGEDEIGKGGVERSFEKYLRGKPGDKVIQVDARGQRGRRGQGTELAAGRRRVVEHRHRPAGARRTSAGGSRSRPVGPRWRVTSTRSATRNAGAAVHRRPSQRRSPGDGVVSHVRSRRSSSTASAPTSGPSSTTSRPSSMLNRAIAESYAPGSTFKLVTAHAALERGLINRDEVVADPGYYQLADCTGKCRFYNAGRARLGAVEPPACHHHLLRRVLLPDRRSAEPQQGAIRRYPDPGLRRAVRLRSSHRHRPAFGIGRAHRDTGAGSRACTTPTDRSSSTTTTGRSATPSTCRSARAW